MRYRFTAHGIEAEGVSLDNVDIDVEYSIDELSAMLAAVPDLLAKAKQFIDSIQKLQTK